MAPRTAEADTTSASHSGTEVQWKLVTIKPSHYCEKARWALDLAKVSFVEESHFPMFSRFHTLPIGGKTTPLLTSGKGPSKVTYTESDDIVDYCDSLLPVEKKLLIEGRREEIDEWRKIANEIGDHTRRLAYFNMFKYTKNLAYEVLSDNVSKRQKRMAKIMMPMIKGVVKGALKVNEKETTKSIERLNSLLDKADKAIEEGDGYLVGGKFTAADLSFASLMAPIIFPPEFDAKMPQPEDLPDQFRKVVEEYRSRPSGKHCLRIFSSYRPKKN
uniref:Glutathione S-transferase n=1 Tax=Palpitomonas bilix TaxID=652834 RepID=A0A7S3GCI4_9EUKA|mmetsp:Transcript_43445/g.113089  ORF Transcript_43445/g.113089 Transcript_43445/m.113089 type:complete len:273 (+) Transcript_43445:39-857(+)